MNTYQQYYLHSSFGYQTEPVNKHIITKQLAYLIEKKLQRQNDPIITIYIKYQNQGCKLQINKSIKLQELNQIISKKFNICKDQQILYINGKQLTNNSFQEINRTCELMNNKQIIYVKSKNRIRAEYYSIIQLSVKIFLPLNFTQLPVKSFNLRFCSDQKLSKLSELILSLDYYQTIFSSINQENKYQINFTQSGRILDSQKTFLSNYLSNNCLINCIISENPIQVENNLMNNEKQIKSQEQSNQQTEVLYSQDIDINININNQNQNQNIKIQDQQQQTYKITIKNPQIQIYEQKNNQIQLNKQDLSYESQNKYKSKQQQILYKSIIDPINKKNIQFQSNQSNQRLYKRPPLLYTRIQKRTNKNDQILTNSYYKVQQIPITNYRVEQIPNNNYLVEQIPNNYYLAEQIPNNNYLAEQIPNNNSQFVQFSQFKQKSSFQQFDYENSFNPYQISKYSFKKKKSLPLIQDIDPNRLLSKIKIKKYKKQSNKLTNEQQLAKSHGNFYQNSQYNDNCKSQIHYQSNFINNIKEYKPNNFNLFNFKPKQFKSSSPFIFNQRKMGISEKVKINQQLSKLFGFSQKQQINNKNIKNQDNQNTNNYEKNDRFYNNQSDQIDKRSDVLQFTKKHTMKTMGNQNNLSNMRNSINNTQQIQQLLKKAKASNRYSIQKMDDS